MSTFFHKFVNKLACTVLLAGVGMTANAQTYSENFETLMKNNYGTDTITLNGVEWIFTGSLAGNSTADYKLGNVSVRMAGTTNSTSNTATSKIQMKNNKPGGIGQVSFVYRRYGTSTTEGEIQWLVQWSPDGNTWNTLDTIVPTANVQTYMHTLNQPTARIRVWGHGFTAGTANTKRMNLDSLVLTNYATNPAALYLTNQTPIGANVPLATDSLTATFSNAITASTGSVKLYKVGQSTPVATFTGANATISGNKAKFSPVTLQNNTAYYVTVDTNTFTYNGAGNSPVSGTAAWTFHTVDTTPSLPTVTYRIPYGANVDPNTDSISVTFSANIAGGAGNVKLYKNGQTAPVATFAGSSATISGNRAKFTPITLEPATSYIIKLDANVATNSAGGNDTVSWTFTTRDTAHYTSLNENFANCISTAIGVFGRYNATGTKVWNCSNFGHNDTNAVYINGGSSATASEANSDWLISSRKFDFAAMTNPTLSFWQKRRFGGAVTRTIKISTNYTGGGDPAAATWTTLTVPALASAPDSNVWSQVKDINLTAYKNTPFYLAFTYECGTTGAYELTYDDIKVENKTTGINTVKGASVDLQVLGMPTYNTIELNIDMKNSDKLEISVFDMMGRRVAVRNHNAQAGSNRVSLTDLNLSTGMYVIQVMGQKGFGTVKAVVR